MKWFTHSIHTAKALSVLLSTFTMVMAPVAQGAEAAKTTNFRTVKIDVDMKRFNWRMDKNVVQNFMKKTGLNSPKKQSYGEYYLKVRATYPRHIRNQMDVWVDAHRNEMMPDIQVSTFKDAEGKEQIRLQVSGGKEVVNIDYSQDSNDKYIKLNNTYLSRADILFPENAILKLAYNDPKFMKAFKEAKPTDRTKVPMKLTYQEFVKLTPTKRAEYFVRLRQLMEVSETVVVKHYGVAKLEQIQRDFYAQWLLGQPAYALESLTGVKCIVAGYVSVYGENKRCGGTTSGRNDLDPKMQQFGGNCPARQVSCNPLLYGFDSSNKSYCVERSAADAATFKDCKSMSKLETNEDKKRIVESYLRNQKNVEIDLKFNEEGKVSKSQYDKISGYLDEMNKYIDQGEEVCNTDPLKQIRKSTPDQDNACLELPFRRIKISPYDDALTGLVAMEAKRDGVVLCDINPNSPVVEGCNCELPNRKMKVGDGEHCLAPEVGVVVDKKKDKCAEGEDRDKNGKCIIAGGFSKTGLIVGGGLALLVGALVFGGGGGNSHAAPPPNMCMLPNAATLPGCAPVQPAPVTPVVTNPPPTQPPPGPIIPNPPAPVPDTPPPPTTPTTPDPVVPPPVNIEVTSNTSTSTAGAVRKMKATK